MQASFWQYWNESKDSCAYIECAAKRMVKGKFREEGQVSLVFGP